MPDKWISAAAAARLLDASATASGRADFAVRPAERRRLSTIGPLSVVRESWTFAAYWRLLLRYERSYNEALRMRLDESDEIATLQCGASSASPPPPGKRWRSVLPPSSASSVSALASAGAPGHLLP